MIPSPVPEALPAPPPVPVFPIDVVKKWFLALALLFVYALSVVVLAGVGLKHLRSGARRKALLNLSLAALSGLLGFCAFYLIKVESSNWL